MKIDQTYIDGLSDDDFVKLLEDDNIDIISCQKEIIQYDNDNKYYVKFNYKIKIINKLFLHNHICIAEKVIIDKLYFKILSDAEFYLKNVKHPSLAAYGQKETWRIIYYNDEIYNCFKHIKNISFDALYNNVKKKLYFGIYKTNDYNNESIVKALENVAKSYGVNYGPYKVIKIDSVNTALSEKDAAINMLKSNFNKDKDKLSGIIIDEIERTKEYLDFLIKLI